MGNDAELVYRVLSGDRDAFGLLVEMHREEVYAMALSMVGDPVDAEDLAQESLIKAYLRLPQLKHPERFRAWLRRIARNHCTDWLRSQTQQYLPIDDMYAEDQLTFPPADERILREDSGRMLASALSSLRAEDEEILKLFYVYGFNYYEIIRASGLSYSAVASRLHKAKKRMRSLMGRYISPSEAGSAIMALSGGIGDMKLGLSTDVLDGIRSVEYAQSTETGKRHFLCGVNLEYTRAGGLRMIASDGRRMAVAQLPGDGEGEDMSVVIPTEELEILKETLGQKSAVVSVEQISENMAAFYIDDAKKLIKLDPGKFPDYRAIAKAQEIYTESITLEREPAVDLMERIIEKTSSNSPSDWVQWDDAIYVSHASDLLEVREIAQRSIELCYTLLGFITKSASPEELSDSIFGHLPREEYQELLDELERRAAPPPEPVGTLRILDSEGEARFVGRFNSHFLLDALRAMREDTFKMRYKMESRANVIISPLLLEDGTDNVHVVMPMKVE